MTKAENIADPSSCWNKAKDDEEVFILLGRDMSTPGTIRDWIQRRLKNGQDRLPSVKLESAEKVAAKLETVTALKVKPSCEIDDLIGEIVRRTGRHWPEVEEATRAAQIHPEEGKIFLTTEHGPVIKHKEGFAWLSQVLHDIINATGFKGIYVTLPI